MLSSRQNAIGRRIGNQDQTGQMGIGPGRVGSPAEGPGIGFYLNG
jgi:hypothetical protein